MASVLEYHLRDLGPWSGGGVAGDEATTTLWVSPDPYHPGSDIYYSEVTMRYTHDRNMEGVFFVGTHPRDLGFPALEDAAAAGTPREQWEAAARQRGW